MFMASCTKWTCRDVVLQRFMGTLIITRILPINLESETSKLSRAAYQNAVAWDSKKTAVASNSPKVHGWGR